MTVPFILHDPILTQAQNALSTGEIPDCSFLKDMNISNSGAVCLYERGFFPWKGLPYPHEHARLGQYLVQLEQRELAKKMACFQKAMLDHDQQPIASLFCQEGRVPYVMLQQATDAFLSSLEGVHLELPVIDEGLGFFRMGNFHTTSLITASGCRTGLGTFLHCDAAILTFAPQLSPVGDCASFGIAGRAQELSYEYMDQQIVCRYRNRLACPHMRETGLNFLADAGYSGLWVQVSQKMSEGSLSTSAQVMGPHSQNSLSWTFFGKARSCVVAGSHGLSPNSLDRYQGPIQKVEMRGVKGSVWIHSSVKGSMEVIPLAGDESFWGANFLVVFRPEQGVLDCTFSHQSYLPV
ncbi:MAG: hypothetical protein JSS62_01365 [Verrucomicrobia bacterium]|nr:hypothetical protein [Verrucomicrobiota bacterium]MBS0645819.1 hypothetical protein [Verrucomicrobiota bacterium]